MKVRILVIVSSISAVSFLTYESKANVMRSSNSAPFAESVIFATEQEASYLSPSDESFAELSYLTASPSLRAAPDLGGDIDGGGSTGIGRDEDVPIPDFTWSNILLFFAIYFLVDIIKRRKYSKK